MKFLKFLKTREPAAVRQSSGEASPTDFFRANKQGQAPIREAASAKGSSEPVLILGLAIESTVAILQLVWELGDRTPAERPEKELDHDLLVVSIAWFLLHMFGRTLSGLVGTESRDKFMDWAAPATIDAIAEARYREPPQGREAEFRAVYEKRTELWHKAYKAFDTSFGDEESELAAVRRFAIELADELGYPGNSRLILEVETMMNKATTAIATNIRAAFQEPEVLKHDR